MAELEGEPLLRRGLQAPAPVPGQQRGERGHPALHPEQEQLPDPHVRPPGRQPGHLSPSALPSSSQAGLPAGAGHACCLLSPFGQALGQKPAPPRGEEEAGTEGVSPPFQFGAGPTHHEPLGPDPRRVNTPQMWESCTILVPSSSAPAHLQQVPAPPSPPRQPQPQPQLAPHLVLRPTPLLWGSVGPAGQPLRISDSRRDSSQAGGPFSGLPSPRPSRVPRGCQKRPSAQARREGLLLAQPLGVWVPSSRVWGSGTAPGRCLSETVVWVWAKGGGTCWCFSFGLWKVAESWKCASDGKEMDGGGLQHLCDSPRRTRAGVRLVASLLHPPPRPGCGRRDGCLGITAPQPHPPHKTPKSSPAAFPSVKAMTRMKHLSPLWPNSRPRSSPPTLTLPPPHPEEPLTPGAGPQLESLSETPPPHRVLLPLSHRKDAGVSLMLKGKPHIPTPLRSCRWRELGTPA